MKAMVITGHGGPEVFAYQEHPDPTLGDYDLLVQVQATSVNPVDCKVRQGSRFQRTFPLILGYDVSGTVVALGERVQGFQIGDAVYASPNLMRPGANAEYVAIDSRSAAHKPTSLDHTSAAVLPLVSLTAWEALYRRADLQPGQMVLIHAGAGGVGHIAIQLAKLRGCQVITTAGRDESLHFCRHSLNADRVINYRQDNFVEVVMEMTAGQGCPVIFDTVGDDVFVQSLECIAVEGQLVTILPTKTDRIADHLFLKSVTLHYEFMGIPTIHGRQPQRQGQILSALSRLVDSGLVTPHVSQTVSLFEQLPQAHQLQETGHTIGKIAVQVT